jgi:tetratricopeptide (TPR) repeat protein
MTKLGSIRTLFIVGTMILCLAATPANSKPASDAPSYLQGVFASLLATQQAQNHPSYFAAWPPVLHVIDHDELNAFASQDKCKPFVVVTSALEQQVLQGVTDRAAFVLGHELSHILLGHVECKETPKQTVVEYLTFTRAQEYAADLNGMKVALAAGYSKRGVEAYRKIDELFGGSSLEALRSDHPSTKDRLARLDEQNAALWRSMAAFDNGVYFLLTEHYSLAETTFDRVTREFPQSYESWGNLGYSRLMEYADALSPEDVKQLHLSAIVAGGFFTRPESILGGVRGRDPYLWKNAVAALTKADELKPNSALIKANLGLAYLMKPEGSDAASAVQQLERANQLAVNDRSLNPVSQTAISMNLAVAYEAAGQPLKSRTILDQIQSKVRQLSETNAGDMVVPAFLYNKGMSLAASGQSNNAEAAMLTIEAYLSRESPASIWWPIAYDRYKIIAATLNKPALSKDELQARSGYGFRQVFSVKTQDGHTIELSAPLDDLQSDLGKGNSTVVAPNLTRISYPQLGVEVIGDDRVVAITLDSSAAPPVILQEGGMGGKPVALHVGMTVAELDLALKSQNAARYTYAGLFSSEERYRFYPDLGLALAVSEDNHVHEIVVVQVPRKTR